LNLLNPETIQEYFGTDNHRAIWESLNTDEGHGNRAIEWLGAMITTQVQGEIQAMFKRSQTLKIQEAHRTSKGIAMRRFINREQSPQCQIQMDAVTEHFRTTWARSLENFVDAEQDSVFHLEPRITEEDEEDMEEFVLNEKNITAVIKSREDLSACGVDGISCRIMKRAGTEGVKFMKNVVRACLRNGRIISTWKEAKTILLHKKGGRDQIENWRPISITNCMYRLLTNTSEA
jgi:hypothetical protein